MSQFILQKYLELRNTLENEDGQTLAEYGLLLALIAIVCILAITALGTSIEGIFNEIADTIGG